MWAERGKMEKNYNKNITLPDSTLQQEYNTNLATVQEVTNIRLQEHWQKRSIDLNYHCQKDINHAAYQKDLATIRIWENVQKTQARANISLEKNLKKLQINVLADGKLKLEQQRFGEPLQDILPFHIGFCKRYVPLLGVHPGILGIEFEEEGIRKSLWLNLDEATPRVINKKFTALGLSFGFGGQRETQLRRLLIEKLIQLSAYIGLPQNHGWYCLDDGPQFVFPDELTWEEVKAYAQ